MKNYNLDKESKIILSLENVSKTFYISDNGAPFFKRLSNILVGGGGQKVKAIKDLSLEVKQGEFLGIIGRNGSGKSTLLRLIMGSMRPDKGGAIYSQGRMIRLALGMGFDPNLTARDNIYLNGTILGLSFKQIGERFEQIIEFSELQNFVDTPIRFYSSGMKSKLSFAVAVHADADVFLIDEFFGSVGDETFKNKSQKAFEKNILKGKTILHVSHSMEVIKKHCNRVLVLNQGSGVIYEDSLEAIRAYREMASKSKSNNKSKAL